MKTLFTFAAAALMATGTFANEFDDLKANSRVNTTYKKISVHLNEGVGKAKISIYDMNGKKLHQRRVKANESVLVPYDMNALPCGEYEVRIATDEEEVTYTVETVDKEEPMPAVLPLMAYGKQIDRNTINLLVLGLEEPGVEVKIRKVADNKLVHQETVDQPEGFKKNYKLNGVGPQDVYFEVTDIKGRTKQIYF
ncbi:T9SS type A sorting domain-containing protein [Algoriphagus sp. AGSA1]|uniref:T9SS type A sorting domain-containing protein n=1 Tax=Algoriphagus sp. AGSA1 TaxID=2907213 RepID=UPI001F201A65|nr:T9SS type A sorting domain-containing protein [Algoriphagus sp. AGSA1]MCE7056803.1 T9SS type A sorting domain-containing protein [Algoriphagus sp. AGSA1]